MKYSHILILLAGLSLSSCTEPIELDILNAEPQLVIEGNLFDSPFGSSVRLSQSGSYTEPGDYPAVSNAKVSLTDDQGNVFELTEGSEGEYQHPDLRGLPDRHYTLTVETETQRITATSKLHPSIPMDSMHIEFREAPAFGATARTIIPFIHFQDPPEHPTRIRFVMSVNGQLLPNLLLYEDGLSNGQSIEYPLPLIGRELKSGDEISLTALTLDEASYRYFNALSEISGQSFGPAAAAPANPPSNLEGSALGYFGAFGLSQIQFQIP